MGPARLRCSQGKGGNEPRLPDIPEDHIQADRDVTVERNTWLFMEQVKMRRRMRKQADGDENQDGRNGPSGLVLPAPLLVLQ